MKGLVFMICAALAAFTPLITPPSEAAMSVNDFITLCQNGTLPQIEAEIAMSADVNAKDKNSNTPLMAAAESNKDTEALNALIQAGADVNAKNDVGKTALMMAAGMNSAEV
ncbi:MAG: ankyrin repeat domain-containing protein [Synergistaceae bacterium]|nr:ankyrin repeat domain-containing protein [Synergistaceae bacterium]